MDFIPQPCALAGNVDVEGAYGCVQSMEMKDSRLLALC